MQSGLAVAKRTENDSEENCKLKEDSRLSDDGDNTFRTAGHREEKEGLMLNLEIRMGYNSAFYTTP